MPGKKTKLDHKRRPHSPTSKAEKVTKEALLAQNKKLRKDLKSLTQERDSLRAFADSCAKQALTREEREALIKGAKDLAPLESFLPELDAILEGS